MALKETSETAEPPALREPSYLGVVFTREGVAEWEHGRRVVFVERGQLRELRHEFGWRAERPLMQATFGATLVAAGLYFLALFVRAFLRDGEVSLPKTFVALALMLPTIGGWALFSAFRRGHFLRATSVSGDARKLLLRGPFDREAFDDFLARARDLGYAITSG